VHYRILGLGLKPALGFGEGQRNALARGIGIMLHFGLFFKLIGVLKP
jgi:hypothetical protein